MTNFEHKTKILMIGPLRRKDKPIGGSVRAFEILVTALQNDPRVQVDVVSSNLSKTNKFSRLNNALFSFFRLASKLPRHDVVALFSTNTSLQKAVRTVGWIARCNYRPLLLRKFGGISHQELTTDFLSPHEAMRITKLMRQNVDLYLPETMYAWEIGRKAGLATGWMPNYRRLSKELKITAKKHCRKFVYIGHVRPGKGIRELIGAAKLLNHEISVDVYGPLMEGITESEFSHHNNIFYRGVLAPDKVISTLSLYDAFVFPTRHDGEGHPGSLIEAFSMGLPAVTTNWKFIPEVADKTCALLVPPGDSRALAEAMNLFAADDTLYQSLSAGARKRSRLFDISIWADIFIQICQCLAARKQVPDDLTHPEKLRLKIASLE